MTTYSILIDVKKCSGCYNCFLACRDEYFGNEYPGYSAAQPLNGQFWMQIQELERGEYPKPKLDYIPKPCLHCQDAPCMGAATGGAVYRRKDGIVMIDPEKAKDPKDPDYGKARLLPSKMDDPDDIDDVLRRGSDESRKR